jgi:carbonyl reductase 1
MSSKICIITGANKGIGFEIAKKMCASQYKVILACRSIPNAMKAKEDLDKDGYDTEVELLDISDPASISAFVSTVSSKYPKIDVLINNAAIAFKGSDPTPFKQQARPTIDPNFFGTLQLVEGLLPELKKSDNPVIVSLASMAGHLRILKSQEKKNLFLSSALTIDGLKGFMNDFVSDVESNGEANSWSNSNYGMSKLGVISMTRILAAREPSIRINCYCPGYCATDMSSQRGSRTPEEGARTGHMLAAISQTGPTGKFYENESESEW